MTIQHLQRPVERWEIADGLSISRVLTGLWQIADMERDGRRLDIAATARAMEPYVAAGLDTFDMADHYGSAEMVVGHYVREHGAESVRALTKWVPKPDRTSRAEVRAAVERALGRLQLEQLPLLQFHAWNYADPSYIDTLRDLDDLVNEGLIAQLGLTNVDTAHLRLLLNSGFLVVSNQVSFSLLDQRARIYGMLDLCQEHGVTLLAFGTLAGGFLTERWLGVPEPDWNALETWSQMKYGRFVRAAGGWDALQSLLEVVHAVAERHGVSMANVAGRYILDQPAVGGVIVGARLGISEHIADSLSLLSFQIDEEGRRQLNEAVAELEEIPGDCGDEYRRPPFLTAKGDLSDHLDAMPPPYETHTGADGRIRVMTGTIWEDLAGFSRAVRQGDRVVVSGTTATHGEGMLGGLDAVSQTHFVIDKIEGALQSVGARLEDVIRTRIYVQRPEDAEAVSWVHGSRFGDILPANTLVQAGIIGAQYLVEMEAEAIVQEPRGEPHA